MGAQTKLRYIDISEADKREAIAMVFGATTNEANVANDAAKNSAHSCRISVACSI